MSKESFVILMIIINIINFYYQYLIFYQLNYQFMLNQYYQYYKLLILSILLISLSIFLLIYYLFELHKENRT